MAAVLAGAGGQRGRVHFVRNLSIFAPPNPAALWAQHARMVEHLAEGFPEAAALLAFATFPREHGRQIGSNTPQERLNKEVRRRSDVVGISLTARPLCAWSAPCWPSSTTSGPWPCAAPSVSSH